MHSDLYMVLSVYLCLSSYTEPQFTSTAHLCSTWLHEVSFVGRILLLLSIIPLSAHFFLRLSWQRTFCLLFNNSSDCMYYVVVPIVYNSHYYCCIQAIMVGRVSQAIFSVLTLNRQQLCLHILENTILYLLFFAIVSIDLDIFCLSCHTRLYC